MLIIFQVSLTWTVVLVPVALALIAVNGIAIGLWLGPLVARYRDVGQIVTSIVRVLFFFTPIFWVTTDVTNAATRLARRLEPVGLLPRVPARPTARPDAHDGRHHRFASASRSLNCAHRAGPLQPHPRPTGVLAMSASAPLDDGIAISLTDVWVQYKLRHAHHYNLKRTVTNLVTRQQGGARDHHCPAGHHPRRAQGRTPRADRPQRLRQVDPAGRHGQALRPSRGRRTPTAAFSPSLAVPTRASTRSRRAERTPSRSASASGRASTRCRGCSTTSRSSPASAAASTIPCTRTPAACRCGCGSPPSPRSSRHPARRRRHRCRRRGLQLARRGAPAGLLCGFGHARALEPRRGSSRHPLRWISPPRQWRSRAPDHLAGSTRPHFPRKRSQIGNRTRLTPSTRSR